MPDMYSGNCLTVYSTAAKTVDIEDYTLTTGVLLAVKFLAEKENTVPAHSTLNVSNTGAIPIVLETDDIEFIPGGNMVYLFTYDGEGYNIIGYNFEDNPDGVSKWYAGTHITGTSETEAVFPQSEVENAVVGDMYLNTNTNNVYRCTFAGVPEVAKWVYLANIEGAPGFSPRATVTKSGSTATITITDEEGTTSETVTDGEDGQDGQMLYATCSTLTDVANKIATLSAGTLELSTGASVAVTFEHSNTAGNPTLNVNSTGAKPIIAIGENLTSESIYNWVADSTVIFVYDGSSWQMDGTTSLTKADDAQKTADTANINISDLDLFINGGYATEVTSDRSGVPAYDEDELRVDKGGFYDKVEGEYGTYEFSYDGTNWKLDGSIVELDTYGIVLDAIPESGDTITVVLTEVIGSMSDINDKYTSLGQVVEDNAESASSDLDAVYTDLQEEIAAQAEALVSTNEIIDGITTITKGMGFTNENGLVLYGKDATDSNGFKLQLAAQAINFINGSLGNASDILANISGDGLTISNATISSQLCFGNFAFIPRSNGNMCLKYLG